MSDNTRIWDALGKTDPAHTKGFDRPGGFTGTAVKPMWAIKRLTEEFGPCGVGWGIGEPSFQVVPAEGEILVFCKVSCWHGSRDNLLHGVGGDKVLTQRRSGPFRDDEAFKKAFTDAVMNAFKFIGVAADVHMGLFDDSKYVAEAREHYAEDAEQELPAAVAAAKVGIDLCKSPAQLEKWATDNADALTQLTEKERATIRAHWSARKHQLTPQKEAA